MLPAALHILDVDLASNDQVSEVFYGFGRRHGDAYGIQGYIGFISDMDSFAVGQILPGFILQYLDYDNDRVEYNLSIRDHSLFCKWGKATENDSSILPFYVTWHYNEAPALNQFDDNNNRNEMPRAQ